MAYIVVKTINGRRYRYLQETYREGGKVKTISKYLGADTLKDAPLPKNLPTPTTAHLASPTPPLLELKNNEIALTKSYKSNIKQTAKLDKAIDRLERTLNRRSLISKHLGSEASELRKLKSERDKLLSVYMTVMHQLAAVRELLDRH